MGLLFIPGEINVHEKFKLNFQVMLIQQVQHHLLQHQFLPVGLLYSVNVLNYCYRNHGVLSGITHVRHRSWRYSNLALDPQVLCKALSDFQILNTDVVSWVILFPLSNSIWYNERQVSSLFLIRKGIRIEKYVSFLIPYLIMNKKWHVLLIPYFLFEFKFAKCRFAECRFTDCGFGGCQFDIPINRMLNNSLKTDSPNADSPNVTMPNKE